MLRLYLFEAIESTIMKTVYKYKVSGKTVLSLPRSAKPVCVAMQGDDLCMWCEVETSRGQENRLFRIFATGEPIPQDMGIDFLYIGTAFDGHFVWHLYEQV